MSHREDASNHAMQYIIFSALTTQGKLNISYSFPEDNWLRCIIWTSALDAMYYDVISVRVKVRVRVRVLVQLMHLIRILIWKFSSSSLCS